MIFHFSACLYDSLGFGLLNTGFYVSYTELSALMILCRFAVAMMSLARAVTLAHAKNKKQAAGGRRNCPETKKKKQENHNNLP